MNPQDPFKWRHFEAEIILLCVRWYLRVRHVTHGNIPSETDVNVKGIVEPSATAKLSHLLALQTIRTMGPVSVNSGESENSHPP